MKSSLREQFPHRRAMIKRQNQVVKHNKNMSLLLEDDFMLEKGDIKIKKGANSLWNRDSPVNKLMSCLSELWFLFIILTTVLLSKSSMYDHAVQYMTDKNILTIIQSSFVFI